MQKPHQEIWYYSGRADHLYAETITNILLDQAAKQESDDERPLP